MEHTKVNLEDFEENLLNRGAKVTTFSGKVKEAGKSLVSSLGTGLKTVGRGLLGIGVNIAANLAMGAAFQGIYNWYDKISSVQECAIQKC